MTRLPKIIRLGIKYRLPMWWDAWDSGLVLRVQTGEALNGRAYSQKVWTLYNIEDAFNRSLELLKLGADLDALNLVVWRGEVNFWKLGWDPDLLPLREQVRAATIDRPWMRPDWDGWLVYKRDNAENYKAT